MNLVTVVIPVSEKHVKFLPQALRSVQEQTLSTSEVLVVNDTDKPLRFGFKTIETGGKKGAAHARNLALPHIHTPFTVFLDADDWLVNTAIETMVRAYATYPEASYIYGDSWTQDLKQEGYYKAPYYDRELLFRQNIHNVTTLLPTEIFAKVGGFDEVIKGWEDWDFYIRVGIAGYCGVRVPSPIILYRLTTGQNRAYSATIGHELVRDVQGRYAAYIKGELPLMGCCGSNPQIVQTVQTILGGSPTGGQVMGQDVLLEFLGEQKGTLPFRVPDGTVYRAANTPMERIIKVKAEHVANLVDRGYFRVVPQAAMQARKPDNAMVDVTRPTFSEASGSAVTKPQHQPNTCVNCEHIEVFHGKSGCQALVGDHACGCMTYSEVEDEVAPVKPQPKKKTVAKRSKVKA